MKTNKYIQLLFLVLSMSLSNVAWAQYDYPIVVEVANPKIKLANNTDNLSETIKAQIQETIKVYFSQIHLVDRSTEEFVAKMRSNMKNTDLGLANIGALGANYLLESKVSETSEKLDSSTYKKYKGTKMYNLQLFQAQKSYTLSMELIDVETGEAVTKAMFQPEGWSYQTFKKSEPRTFETTINEALIDQKNCFQSTLRYMLTDILPLKLDLLALYEVKKDKAKKILIAGGANAGYFKNQEFMVVKIYNQEVSGKSIQRQEKIGKVEFDKNTAMNTICKVKDGDKEILTEYNEGASLYCVPIEKNAIENCNSMFMSPQTRAKRAEYNGLASNDSKPKSKAEIAKEKEEEANKKRIQSKKVTKKGNG